VEPMKELRHNVRNSKGHMELFPVGILKLYYQPHAKSENVPIHLPLNQMMTVIHSSKDVLLMDKAVLTRHSHVHTFLNYTMIAPFT